MGSGLPVARRSCGVSESEIETSVTAIGQGIIPMVIFSCHIDITIASFNIHRFDDSQAYTSICLNVVVWRSGK